MTRPTDAPEPIELPWGRLAEAWRLLRYYRWPRVTSRFRRWWAVRSNPHATVRFGHGCTVGPGFRLVLPAGGTFIAGDHVEFRNGFRCEMGLPTTRVEIGSGTVFTYGVLIQCSTEITIGERCVFAEGSMIVDGNHRYRDLSKPMLEQGYDYRAIRIEDDVSAMVKSTIIANIGTRAFVGANSVVVKDIPPYTLAAGVPARVLDYFGPPGLEPPDWQAKDLPAGIEGWPVLSTARYTGTRPHGSSKRPFSPLNAAVPVKPAPGGARRARTPPTPRGSAARAPGGM